MSIDVEKESAEHAYQQGLRDGKIESGREVACLLIAGALSEFIDGEGKI